MSLNQSRQRLERLQREVDELEAELKVQKAIAKERDRMIQAKVALDLLNETVEQKAEREEAQRKLAAYCRCEELDPNGDWRNKPLHRPQAHRGGSVS